MKFSSRRFLLSAIALLAWSCASTPEPSQVRSDEGARQVLGELAGLRHISERGLRLYYLADFEHGDVEDGYIFFKAGTAKPVAYGGKFGSCAREPAIPTLYRGISGLRCAFPDNVAVEIHGYAWPDELEGSLDGKTLSQRRAEVLERRLGASALPSSAARVEAHGTSIAKEGGAKYEEVIGVRFEVVGCGLECDPSSSPAPPEKPSGSSEPARRREPSAPMMWLRRHDRFRPDWEEIDTESLGERRLVFHEVAFESRIHETTVIVGDERTLCREMEVGNPHSKLHGAVFFEPGTATPIAYSGGASCLAEPPFDNPPQYRGPYSRMYCSFHSSHEVIFDGYAWDFEKESAQARKELSRQRLKVVESRLNGTALPSKIYKSKAHGASATTAPVDGTRPLPGVAITIARTEYFVDQHGFQYKQSKSSAWSDVEMAAFQDFMAEYQHRPERLLMSTAEWHASLQFRTQSGTVVDEYMTTPNSDRTAFWAVIEWADALVDNGCDVSKVGMPDKFLDR